MIKVAITGWCFEYDRLSMIQRMPNMEQVIARKIAAVSPYDDWP